MHTERYMSKEVAKDRATLLSKDYPYVCIIQSVYYYWVHTEKQVAINERERLICEMKGK